MNSLTTHIPKPKLGITLSGGGARGFSHLGVLQAFDELQIPIAKLSGSSAGAITAALYASGKKPQEILEIINKRSFWKYVNLRPSKWGLMNLKKMGKILAEELVVSTFEDLKIPLVICATNISRGNAAYFCTGDLVNPILASSAIPLIFKPIEIDGYKYLDGGLSNNLPLEGISECDFKVAVNVTPFHKSLPVKSAKDVVMKSIYISVDMQTKLKSEKADLVIEPDGIMRFDGMSMKDADKLFEIGYNSAIRILKEANFDKTPFI